MNIDIDDLPHRGHAHEFVGAEPGDVLISLSHPVHSAPGAGPALHRHRDAEILVIGVGLASGAAWAPPAPRRKDDR